MRRGGNTANALIRLLRCPACNATGRMVDEDRELRCTDCAASYPVRDGFVDLIPEQAVRRSIAQIAMEAPPLVAIYESRLWRRSPIASSALGIAFEEEQRVICEAAGLSGSETILDLACGPGIYLRPLARALPHGAVIGLDLSAPMLAYAAKQARAESLANVLFVRGTAMDLPFAADTFDAANCSAALHLFPDARRALRETHRVLRPGGRLTLAVFRQPDGWLGRTMTALPRRLLGIDAYTRFALDSMLRETAFRDVRCHHAEGVWIIESARKPPRPRPKKG